MVRGKFSSTMVRQADGAGFCSRDDDEQGLCGTYAIVTDYLGKPVLTLNATGNTSGTGTYEAFGWANRREYRWGSPHDSTSASTTIIPPLPPPGLGGFDGPLRVLTSRSKFGSGSVTLAGNSENSLLNGDRAHTWTNWRYSSNSQWTVAWTGPGGPPSPNEYGIDIEAYEVQSKEYGTWWAWPRLRFPGHYFDKETELNENWNRYFDPRTNRYLAPEPLTQLPLYLRRMAQRGGYASRPTPTV
jgi:RHS repeat-associated protein